MCIRDSNSNCKNKKINDLKEIIIQCLGLNIQLNSTNELGTPNSSETFILKIVNLNNGERLVTYAFEAPRGSKIISMNGAAALKAKVGHLVIIAAYAQIDESEYNEYQPKILKVSDNN